MGWVPKTQEASKLTRLRKLMKVTRFTVFLQDYKIRNSLPRRESSVDLKHVGESVVTYQSG